MVSRQAARQPPKDSIESWVTASSGRTQDQMNHDIAKLLLTSWSERAQINSKKKQQQCQEENLAKRMHQLIPIPSHPIPFQPTKIPVWPCMEGRNHGEVSGGVVLECGRGGVVYM